MSRKSASVVIIAETAGGNEGDRGRIYNTEVEENSESPRKTCKLIGDIMQKHMGESCRNIGRAVFPNRHAEWLQTMVEVYNKGRFYICKKFAEIVPQASLNFGGFVS